MRVSREEHPLPHGCCGRKENPQQSLPAPSPPLGSCASSAELESDFDFKDHKALLGLGSTGASLPGVWVGVSPLLQVRPALSWSV